ncbi:MAG: hypothetical protein K2Q25_10455 [Mycobacteriaceae bacterium]|nr:hypothetical protein [Mycobacteriaceae bacterium]
MRGKLVDSVLIAGLATLISGAWSSRPSLWFDEGATISAAASRSLPQLWRLLNHIDTVHGLYYLLMHGWFRVFPPTEFWSRAPSCLAVGAAAGGVVVFTKQFSRQVSPLRAERATAVCAGILFAILPRITWAGIEARPYAAEAAAAVWLTVLLIAAVRRNRWWLWLLYALVLMLSQMLSINLALLVLVYAAMLPMLAPTKSAALCWAAASTAGLGLMTPFIVFAHHQVGQVGWISGLKRNLLLDVVHRQYFDHSVAFAILYGLVLSIAIGMQLTGLAKSSDNCRPLALVCLAWIGIPTGVVLLYSAIIEPIYYPRYLILTTPGIAIMLALCIVQIGRTPWPIATIVVLFAAAAFPNYLFTQRGPYAKEGWDYSQVADLISAHAVPGDCLLVDNTVSWRPGPIRALLATRPAAFAPLVDIERGFRGADVGALWDGHVAVWLRTAQINQCTTVWTITNRDTTLPRQQSGQALPPGPVLARTPVYRFPAQLGFRIVERWQFHYAQVIKSTR